METVAFQREQENDNGKLQKRCNIYYCHFQYCVKLCECAKLFLHCMVFIINIQQLQWLSRRDCPSVQSSLRWSLKRTNERTDGRREARLQLINDVHHDRHALTPCRQWRHFRGAQISSRGPRPGHKANYGNIMVDATWR